VNGDQALPGGGINSPASGTYGEKASLQRLEQSLPKAAPPGPGQEQGAPVAPLPNTSPAPRPQPGAVPAGILSPSTMPDVPQSTPLAGIPANPMVAAQTARQRRLSALDAWISNPATSPETKEWAQTWRDKLIRLSAR
jgi:hypothetical protein